MRFVNVRGRDRDCDVEITPMIDVIFLLIIFFMTTAQVARFTRAEVDLPKERGEQSAETDEAGLVINLTAEGEIIIASRVVDITELESIVRGELRRDPDLPAHQLKLLLRADRNAAAGHLNRLVSLLESLGVGQARLATEVPG
jgi:biopolymer transport protein ExbD